MRSDLFSPQYLEQDAPPGMSLQNPKLLKVRLAGGELMAAQGSMVAYQGSIDFAYQGAGGMSRFMKKALTGEGVDLMKVSGSGDVFLADREAHVFLVDLEGDSITVSGHKVLAFDSTLTWDIKRVEGASMMAGGLFNTVFTGHGRVALTSEGPPLVLDAAEAPTFVDVNAVVCWASSLKAGMRRTVKASAMIGRGSGEAVQLAFTGQGFVVVQPSEGLQIASGH